MGGNLPPISFWTPCLGPPGPAANHCRPPGRNTAHWLIIGRTSCVKLAGLSHDASGLWWEILHPQPIPRSAVPRSKKAYFSATFSSTGKRITRFSFIQAVVFWLQPNKRRADDHRASRMAEAKKKGRFKRSGPVRSFVVKAECEVRRLSLSAAPGDIRMRARATTTSTASRSHSTSDHLLSVVAAANKFALFGRFEKPARLLVPEEALR